MAGLLLNPPAAAATELLNWLVPLVFGWYVAVLAERYANLQTSIATTFQWAISIAGLYGIYQFIVAPAWDGYWLDNVGARSMGTPEPFHIRVFSTMHSPAVLAITVVVGLTMWLGAPKLAILPGMLAACVALLLSQVRSAWVVFAIALLFLVPSLKVKSVFRLAIATALIIPLLVLAVSREPFNLVITDRFATLGSLSQDESAYARMESDEKAINKAMQNPLGFGLGAPDDLSSGDVTLRDSVLMAALAQLGFGGCALYLAGVLLLFRIAWLWRRQKESALSVAMASVLIALAAQIYIGSNTLGPGGVCFWTLGGLAVARRRRMDVSRFGYSPRVV